MSPFPRLWFHQIRNDVVEPVKICIKPKRSHQIQPNKWQTSRNWVFTACISTLCTWSSISLTDKKWCTCRRCIFSFFNMHMSMWNGWKWLVSTLFSFTRNLWIAKRCVWVVFPVFFIFFLRQALSRSLAPRSFISVGVWCPVKCHQGYKLWLGWWTFR